MKSRQGQRARFASPAALFMGSSALFVRLFRTFRFWGLSVPLFLVLDGYFLNQLFEPCLHLRLFDGHVKQLDDQKKDHKQEDKIRCGVRPRKLRQDSRHHREYAEQDQHKGKANPEEGILYLQL